MTGMYSEDDLLSLSLLQHLMFCERRAVLIQTEGLWEENLFTTEGTIFHRKVDDDVPVESRKDVRITRGLLLRSLRLGLSGKADVVEFHLMKEEVAPPVEKGLQSAIPLEGARGLWQPYPVDYKRGRMRHERGYEVQLCAQAMCLEEMLGVAVPEGALFYGTNRRRQAVSFDDQLRRETEEAAVWLHALVRSGKTPPACYEKKCESCSLFNLCMPKVSGGKRRVERYLQTNVFDL